MKNKKVDLGEYISDTYTQEECMAFIYAFEKLLNVETEEKGYWYKRYKEARPETMGTEDLEYDVAIFAEYLLDKLNE